ncbi:MAG: 3-keto-5-aminohexanoate cleavage protein [Chloroflexi bacterium]|nr:3-keto-5-aminohexanoate cleavage protein [Chloroflexota bacterium]
MDGVIISVAPTGSVPTREHTPHVPLTPQEIAADVYRCWQAGAAIAHIHARDAQGRPTADKAVFAEIKERIESKCDIIVMISTGGRASSLQEDRAAPLTLRPEMASLTTGSVNFPTSVYVNSPSLIEALAKEMKSLGIKPELEIFDTAMITNALDLLKKQLILAPLHFQFVMGVQGAIAATPKNLFHLVESIPPGSTWSVAGIGRAQLPMTALGLLLGGHVRVGLEDNLQYSKGVLATNQQLVERVARLAGELGRPVCSPDEARAILGLARTENT